MAVVTGAVVIILVGIASVALLQRVGAPSLPTDRPRPSSTAIASPTEEPQAAEWTGPIRSDPGGIRLQQMLGHGWAEGRDTAIEWVDITGIRWSQGSRLYIDLAALPPAEDVLRPDETVIAYGLVVETTGDDVADFVLGIDNNAPTGEHRTWRTDLATGQTREQIGSPYGIPFDSFYPGEEQPGEDARPSALFISLSAVRVYAWASVTRDGEVIAWDYAPNTTWLTPPPTDEP
jgi:hypothetical protein